MPETDVIPTSASVASTGKGIRYIGDYAYANSGWLSVATGADTVLLDFTSGAGMIKADLFWSFDYDLLINGKYFGVELKFNDIVIMRPRAEQRISGSGHGTELTDELKMIIPPFTRVVVNAQTDDDGTEAGCILTGRVYGDK